jgi:hypothetical protein
MIYNKVLDGSFIVRTATPEDAIRMEYVQAQCFPTLHESELMNRAHFANHIKVFRERPNDY